MSEEEDVMPWADPNRPHGRGLSEELSAERTAQLLQHDEFQPPPPSKITGQDAEYDDSWESEEGWLRELARRVNGHAARFGAVDKQIRRELDLAAQMLNAYAEAWERNNKKGKGNG